MMSVLNAYSQTVDWAYRAGSSFYPDMGQVVKVDNQGNTYVAGYFNDTVKFDPNSDNYTFTAPDPPFEDAIFLEKFSASGTFLWAKVFYDGPNAMSVVFDIDPQDNVYIAATFNGSIDLNPGAEEDIRTSPNGALTAFIVKLSNTGEYMYGKTFEMGENSYIYCDAITFDGDNNLIIGGMFHGNVDFDLSADEHRMTTTPFETKSFLLKMSSAGDFDWSKSFNDVYFHSIKTDSQNNIISGGVFNRAVDMDPGDGVVLLDSQNYSSVNMFILKIDIDGNYMWVKSASDLSDPNQQSTYYQEVITSIAVDQQDNIYFTGSFTKYISFDMNGTDVVLQTLNDINHPLGMLGKYNSTGGLQWVKMMEGNHYTPTGGEGQSTSSTNCLATTDDGRLFFGYTFDGILNYTINGYNGWVNNSGPAGNAFVAFMEINTQDGTTESIYSIYSPSNVGSVYLWDLAASGDYLYSTGWFFDSLKFNEENVLIAENDQPDIFAAKFSPLTLGSKNIDGKRNFAYPNPAKDIITITNNSFTIEHVTVIDITGKTVKDIAIPLTNTYNLDVADLTSGQYILQVKGANSNIVKKIIIE